VESDRIVQSALINAETALGNLRQSEAGYQEVQQMLLSPMFAQMPPKQRAGLLAQMGTEATPESVLAVRSQAEADLRTAVDQVVEHADDSDAARLASAWLARGELYWTLATAPAIAVSSTQPATQPIAPPLPAAEYFNLSKQAYERVANQYTSQHAAVAIARFSLAAIAENAREWDAAKQQYQALIESTDTLPANKAMAEKRIAALDELKTPPLLLPPAPPESPTTAPILDSSLPNIPAVLPTIAPTAAPTTAPTTAPAAS
jgi:hypothetical protein